MQLRSEKVIRQIIWKIMPFFGTFFKVKNLFIGDDLEITLGVATNMYYALYKNSLNSPESLRAVGFHTFTVCETVLEEFSKENNVL